MKLVIHPAFGEGIQARNIEMNMLIVQFNILKNEDKRQTDAILKSLGVDPGKYPQYKLIREGEEWALELTGAPVAGPDSLPAPIAAAEGGENYVNGAA